MDLHECERKLMGAQWFAHNASCKGELQEGI